MNSLMILLLGASLLNPVMQPAKQSSGDPVAQRDRDLIYGRKYGLSLTMDRFVPKNPNGKAVILVI